MTRGLLVVGHGTRDERGRAEFLSLVDAIAARASGVRVQPAFLELDRPSVHEALRLLASRDVRQVVVQPLLLIAAGHLKRDLPEALLAASEAVEIVLAPHLGCEPVLVELSVKRFEQAVGLSGEAEVRETLTVLVGRGTSDAVGQAEFRRFASLRRAACETGGFEVCYVAAAEPALEGMLLRAAVLPHKRVVVQPHLLFCGEVLDSIADSVERIRHKAPHKEWVLAPHLGPAPELARLVAERALSA